MVYVGDDAEVAIPLDWDVCDALLELRLRSEDLGIPAGKRVEMFKAAEYGLPTAIGASRERPPALQCTACGPDA